MVNYNLLIQITLKNIFINLFDRNGNTIFFLTAGQLGFDGKQKKAPLALHSVLYRLVKILRKRKIYTFNLFLKNTMKSSRKIIKYLHNTEFSIKSLNDSTTTVHNGCRKPRRKRR